LRFGELIGQRQATAIVGRAIAHGRVPHAYLFEGPAGVGKRSAALALAAALDCERPPAPGDSCGACDTCRRIDAGIHPDVVTFVPDGTQILMEQAQEIVTLGQRGPHEARARVIIVDDADRMNVNAANCLLKTLEEPSPGTHLVLVTPSPERLLATIRSRAQRVRFGAVSLAALLDLGARRGADRHAAEVAAVLADGSVARFVELLTEADAPAASADDDETTDGATPGHRAVVESAAETLRAAARGRGCGPIFDAAAELGNKESKSELPAALALLARMYRDALVTAAGAPELAVLGAAGDQGLAPSVGPPNARPLPALARAVTATLDAETALAANVNTVMVLERLLLALRREERGAP